MDVCSARGTRRCTTSVPARWCEALNGWLAAVLDDLGVLEPDRHANQLYLQAIGVLHLARSGVGSRAIGPGVVEALPVTLEQVRAACVQLALAAAPPD